MGLLAIPRAAAGSAKLCDDVAELFKRSHSEPFDFVQDRIRVAESKNSAALLLAFITGFLDFVQNEYENVIAFQSPPHSFQFADLEARKNQIFADQLFPFTVEHFAIFHHHGDKKMRFEHSNTRAKGIVKPVTTRFDPEQYPDDGEVEKENNMRHFTRRKCDGDDGGGTGDRPV